jgi:c-di-GMP-binding flagellar brake protein YcgR
VKSPSERRGSERFSIESEVRYRVFKKRKSQVTGNGKTVNISSSGVLFTSDEALKLGERLELSISWPVRLDNKKALKLVVLGDVVRVEQGRAAMHIRHHEFLTQSSNSH